MNVIVIGAGPAGCEAAFRLAEEGIEVELIEKESMTGGNLNNWYQLFPDRKNAGELNAILRGQLNHPQIRLHLNAEAVSMKKLGNGKFSVELSDRTLLESDALLVTTGFKIFEAYRKEEYGYRIYDNVITSVELENKFMNHRITTSSGEVPKRIGFIHCVGSRDEKICNYHCSKLCCITAVKQAIEVREMLPEAEILCFYMDMRMFGPGYEEMYREAQEKYNIKFVRGRLSEASENQNKQIIIKAEDTLIGKPLRMMLDLMVLMVGMEASEGSRKAAAQLQLKQAPNGFIQSADPHYGMNRTNEEGIFIAGCSSAPMNLTDTLADARSAATTLTQWLKGSSKH
ncbi:MAG: FAD-dependent oxidoreductase [Odoribacter sp.]|nr:FAD-dependent oxidoreductase [Odoribacter sp.]